MRTCFVLFYSFFRTKPRDCLGRTSPKLPILCRAGRKTTTPSISQSINQPKSLLAARTVSSELLGFCRVTTSGESLRGEGLVRLIGAVVCLLAA